LGECLALHPPTPPNNLVLPQALADRQPSEELDILVGEDGTKYLVQTEWSNRDGTPVAFAATAQAWAQGFGLGG
jgi:hypothetical protein